MSWQQLISIAVEAVGHLERERTEPPVACPYDGEPLRSSPTGGLFCPFGNYDWPYQRRVI